MIVKRDQKAIALVRLTTKFLKIEPLAFCFKAIPSSDAIVFYFDSEKYGVNVSLMLAGKNRVISLDIGFSELTDDVSKDVKPILEQFLTTFRKIARQFTKSVEFEVYCYGPYPLSVTTDDIFKILTT